MTEVVGRRRYARAARWSIGVVVVLIVVAAGWLGVRGGLAARQLVAANSSITSVQNDLERSLNGAASPASARTAALVAARHTRSAAQLTGDPLWSAARHLPWVGRIFDTTRRSALAADLVVRVGLPPALQATDLLAPARAQFRNATVPLAPFVAAAPLLDAAVAAVDRADDLVRGARGTGIGLVDDELAKFRSHLSVARARLDDVDKAAHLLPPMLGSSGTRRYFVGFLNNSEARSQGGLLGSYGILRASGGHLVFEHFGSDVELKDSATPAVNLGQEFNNAYNFADVTTSWRDSPAAADFRDVGAIWLALWKHQTGETLDGAISTDPVALSYVLRVTGGVVAPNGVEVTSSNVVSLLESQSYAQISDTAARKQYFLDVAKAASERVLGTAGLSQNLLASLGDGVGSDRMKVWSAHPAEQGIISGLPLSGALPTPGSPLAYLVVNNSVGNKMDYYLARKVTYSGADCGNGATVTVSLTNTGPTSGLSDYVAPSAAPLFAGLPKGTTVLTTAVYLDGSQTFSSATLDGKTTSLRQFPERGLTAVSTVLNVLPGQTTTLVIHLSGPKLHGSARMPSQPLVIEQRSTATQIAKC